MLGYRFSQYTPLPNEGKPDLENLLKIFMQLLTITAGNVQETLDWMNSLDRQYGITDDDYGMGDFIQDLKDKGYLTDKTPDGAFAITPKSEQFFLPARVIFGGRKHARIGLCLCGAHRPEKNHAQ